MPSAARGRPRPGRLHGGTESANKSVSAIMERVHIPRAATAEDKGQREEQELARLELMMLKGVRKPAMLAATLNLPERSIPKMIEKVHARWEITGNGRDITKHRGEALSKFDLIESELWVAWSNAVGYKAQSSFMRLIMDISGMRNELLGLTPKVIERLALLPIDTNAVAARVAQQTGLAQMAGRLAELIGERRKALGLPSDPRTIDHVQKTLEPNPHDFTEDELDDAEA